MCKSIPGTQKHMTLDQRIMIEKGLDQGSSFRSIALQLGKDPTTISKEIKKHRIFREHNHFNDAKNKCALVNDCKKRNICKIYAPVCKRMCKLCNHCNSRCDDFTPKSYHCAKLDKAPFVCNPCKKKSGCRLDKAYYRATIAHKQYRTVLVESRTGINISPGDLIKLDELVSPLILNGQSPYMILQHHPEIPYSEKTIYNYIESGALSVKNIDLPKKVKYKIRSLCRSKAADKAIFEGRTYRDFQEFIKEFPDTRVTEMDTVLGCEGSRKVLLTFHFSGCSFMMACLLDSKESRHVKNIFDSIEHAIGTCSFASAFSLILTDRGGEFQNPDDDYSQKDINLMMSHINSSPRQSLGGLSPMALAKLMLPQELLDFFDLSEIPPDEIILTPALLKK